MNVMLRPATAVLSLFMGLTLLDAALPRQQGITSETAERPPLPVTTPGATQPRIQAAILLDVSGSMNGLIEQAKAQLWNMVTVMGRAKCDGTTPAIEIALYEYGRSDNDAQKGYIRQISPFSSDLDQLSQELFKLKTNGGDEYCGHVIHTSLDELNWDTASSSYKVIFIAGNEDFLQGNIPYTRACRKANDLGVIVNTIYCGSREQGIREHWNLAGECGTGSFTHIDHNYQEQSIYTPYDSTLLVLNGRLNQTYIPYGYAGAVQYEKQASVDKMNKEYRQEAMAARIAVKGNKALYNNAGWDLVDAAEKNKDIIADVDMNTLPDSLKTRSRDDLRAIIRQKSAERGMIQAQIASANLKREAYIAAEKAKTAGKKTTTLETEIERIIRQQVQRYRMRID